jgi:hypothetical protein
MAEAHPSPPTGVLLGRKASAAPILESAHISKSPSAMGVQISKPCRQSQPAANRTSIFWTLSAGA